MKQVIKNTRNLYSDIWKWIKNPKEGFLHNLSFRDKLVRLFKILILDFLIAVILGFVLHYIHNNVQRLEAPLEPFSLWELILILSLVVPLLEEIIFRLPLVYKRNYLARGLDKLTKGFISRKWNSIYRYFVYTLAATFGLVHIGNFSDVNLLLLALSPIVVGGQLIGGLMISYVRVKFGFVWGLAQHVIFNSIIGLLILSGHNSVIIQVSNSDIELDIRRLEYVDSDSSSLNVNKANDKIFSIEANDYQLQEVLDDISDDTVEAYDNVWVDVNFESEDGITVEEMTELLGTKIKLVRD